jgi:hypothetical protein
MGTGAIAMKAKLITQVRLRSQNPDGKTYAELTCFIDNAKVRIGSKVTLKNSAEPDRKWEVTWKSAAVDPATVHTDWHVGGL